MIAYYLQTGDVAKTDYANLSTVLVYLEAIKYDDIEHHNSSLLIHIRAVESKILTSLCRLGDILQSLELSVDSHVTREVMPSSLREISSTADRRMRDYVMAKDCVHVLTETKDSHLALQLGLAEI